MDESDIKRLQESLHDLLKEPLTLNPLSTGSEPVFERIKPVFGGAESISKMANPDLEQLRRIRDAGEGPLTAAEQSQVVAFVLNHHHRKEAHGAPLLIDLLARHVSGQRSLDFGLREKMWPNPLEHVSRQQALSFRLFYEGTSFLIKCQTPDPVPLFCDLLGRLTLPRGLAGSSVAHTLERDLYELLLQGLGEQNALATVKHILLALLADRTILTPSYVLDAADKIVDDEVILGYHSALKGLLAHPDTGKFYFRFSSAAARHLQCLRCDTLRAILVLPSMEELVLNEQGYSVGRQPLDHSSLERLVRDELNRRCC